MEVLESLEEIISIGLKFKFNWFRGHSRPYNDLTPKVFRSEYFSKMHLTASSENPEGHIIEEFKRLAPSMQSDCPPVTEHLQWLILMQHFGTPTRLLDWSESILVSAFFAVNDHKGEDAEIWRLYPQKLNSISVGYEGLPVLAYNKQIQYLAEEPLYVDLEKLVKKLDIEAPVSLPVAFNPIISFPRITAQGGVFSIHPRPTNDNSLIDLFSSQPENLKRYLIPAARKLEILMDLNALGINYRTLFAHLDGLSKDISLKYSNPFWNVWSQPDEE